MLRIHNLIHPGNKIIGTIARPFGHHRALIPDIDKFDNQITLLRLGDKQPLHGSDDQMKTEGRWVAVTGVRVVPAPGVISSVESQAGRLGHRGPEPA